MQSICNNYHKRYTWVCFFELELFRALCVTFFGLQVAVFLCLAMFQPGKNNNRSMFGKIVEYLGKKLTKYDRHHLFVTPSPFGHPRCTASVNQSLFSLILHCIPVYWPLPPAFPHQQQLTALFLKALLLIKISPPSVMR